MLTKKGLIGSLGQARELANSFLSAKLVARGITDILPSQGGIFGLLFCNGGTVQMKDIPEAIQRTKSTVNCLVNTLEQNGYVERTACSTDKRVSFVKLTQKGWDLRPVFQDISHELIVATTSNLEQAEIDTFLLTLSKIISNLQLQLAEADSDKEALSTRDKR